MSQWVDLILIKPYLDIVLKEKIMMRSLSAVAIALGLLLASGCMSSQMASLQQKCNAGDQNACTQLQAPPPTPGGVQ